MKKNIFHERQFPLQANPSYPEKLKRNYRYRLLVDDAYMKMGTLELDTGAHYPAHSHPAAEVYYLMHGRARWRIGNEESEILPGAVMMHSQNASHEFENIGNIPLKLLWVWWAKDGNTEKLNVPAVLLSILAEQASDIDNDAK
jgi:mannose-6-phosphate isomerase-like protein (cupin superfamily)